MIFTVIPDITDAAKIENIKNRYSEYLNFDKYLNTAQTIITRSVSALEVAFPFMIKAIHSLKYVPAIGSLMTDGQKVYFDPMFVCMAWKYSSELSFKDSRPENVAGRMVLHTIFHCIFKHHLDVQNKDPELWDLACDIAVESIISSLDKYNLKIQEEGQQNSAIGAILKDTQVLSAQNIYAWLKKKNFTEQELQVLHRLFAFDDHTLWYNFTVEIQTISMEGDSENPDKQNNPDSQNSQNSASGSAGKDKDSEENEKNGNSGSSDNPDNQNKSQSSRVTFSSAFSSAPRNESSHRQQNESWSEIGKELQTGLESFMKYQGSGKGSLIQMLKAVNRERWDYTRFLQQFAVNREVLKPSEDEFDYSYYTMGLNLYGNVPLVEPLEYKEAKRIEEFVIIIDTSGSVSGQLVQNFIQKTFNILKSAETFTKRFNIHIIQCDYEVQEDKKLTSQEDLDSYLKTMQLKGFGGTDFRPAFEYVNRLIDSKELTNLKGLLYFTDGYGTFPAHKQNYKTAFVFMDEPGIPSIPPWAMKVILSAEDLELPVQAVQA